MEREMKGGKGGSTRRTMEKCGICGKDVPEQPTVSSEGTCSACGAKLKMGRESEE